MKIALITDTHSGVKADSEVIHDALKNFYSKVFFPFLKKNKITTIIHLGDLVDKRKYITGNTLKRVREDFIEPIIENGMACHLLIGNHDCSNKNSLTPNYVTEILKDKHDNIYYYDKPEYIDINSLQILMLPWICKENYDQSLEMIKENKARVVIGHLELSGFQMYKGHSAREGMKPSLFNDYHLVLSGHYHTKSNQEHIHYLGTPLDLTWADYQDPKGFHVLDTETLELTFIKNPVDIHHRIVYNDSLLIDEKLTNKIVKVVIESEYNPQKFDTYIDDLSKIVFSYSIEDKTTTVSPVEITQEQIEVSDTLSIFKSFLNEPKLNSMIEDIYTEALSIR